MRKVCFVTGTRAEYGLLRNLIHLVDKDEVFELQVIATGTHLSKKYGETKSEILNDGINIDEEVDILKFGNDKLSVAKSMGLAISGIAESLNKLNPDILIILGDRYECLAAAEAALILGIPIAHIHGGEVTEGAIDDAFRHSITKMSNLHFVSNNIHKNRVIQLGEESEHVFDVGAPGLDNALEIKLKNKNELSKELGIDFKDKIFIVTYHPVTIASIEEKVAPLLEALSRYDDATIIITMPNADANSAVIKDSITEWSKNRANIHVADSLGFVNYLSVLGISHVVIGNSSSGIIEAPMMKLPTVNIGVRQNGRERSNSIFDVECDADKIVEAIDLALEFKENTPSENYISVYGNGTASRKIFDILKNIDIKTIVTKKFIDLVR